MTTIVIAPSNVVTFPEGGGHFWVYMQYVQGFLNLGCEVYWLESFTSSGDKTRNAQMLSLFFERMERYGLKDKALLYTTEELPEDPARPYAFLNIETFAAEKILRKADLLLNFYYSMEQAMLSNFRRTALVDIDPGLLQFWISTGQLTVALHDLYFSTGETVGTPGALFPDCGLPWKRIRPPVSLKLWPYTFDASAEAFTTISSWWGSDGKGEFITNGKDIFYENNKRVTFLDYVTVPQLTSQPIELALNMGEGDPEDESDGSDQQGDNQDEYSEVKEPAADSVTDYVSDAIDRKLLLKHGWRVRHSYEVAISPESYQEYIQQSRGEFSCVKPSCIVFQNAWISDRTICYLASGKPAVIQDTGTSAYLPDGEGMFRFSSVEEVAEAFSSILSDYEKHCRAAREIAETYFDARTITSMILDNC